MKRRLRRPTAWLASGLICALAIFTLVGAVLADSVKLTDGTVYVGQVKKIGSTYQIITEDGQYKFVPESKVAEINGAAPGNAGAASADSGAASPAVVPSGNSRAAYNETKKRADQSDEPVRAVALWDTFLSRKGLSEAEKAAAEKERAYWNRLYSEGAEKLRGQWIMGEELKAIKDEAGKLVEEAKKAEDGGGSMLDAVAKYRKAVNTYPNSFEAHYRLAYIKFHEGVGQAGGNASLRESERHARLALRLEPDLPAVQTSCGAVMFALDKYEEGIELMWKAVRNVETDITVGNLMTALSALPPRWLQNNSTLRQINLDAGNLLRGSNARGGGGGLLFVPDYTHGVEDLTPGDDTDKGPPGLQGNGSGFFISPDGYLLTNKHVAETDDGKYYRVRLDGKDEEGGFIEYNARFIANDDKFDVALLKVDLPEGETVPYLHILPDDFPPDAAQVMVLGYPATGSTKQNMQIAVGTVKSNNPGEEHEVWFDLSTTHGNSGGPIVDRNGSVVGILTGGRTVYNVTYVLGVGPRQIREFFDRIGDKAPVLEYGDIDQDWNQVELAKQCRPATLLVLIFRGELDGDGTGGGEDAGESAGASDGGGVAGPSPTGDSPGTAGPQQ